MIPFKSSIYLFKVVPCIHKWPDKEEHLQLKQI